MRLILLPITFGGYSISQIKKARGLNKKIVNPIDKEGKTPIDFCYIALPLIGSQNLRTWLNYQMNFSQQKQENYGLQNINNMKGMYYLYFKENNYRGIVNDDLMSSQLRLSSIPKGEEPVGIIYFNQDGYSTYCKDYKEYWDWVEKRNPVRYNDNISHNQGYDGKNLMHCLRMLDMAIEIARGEGVNLVRPNREWLLSVRKGMISYTEIIELIEEKKRIMDEEFDKSTLPEEVSAEFVHNLILQIRQQQIKYSSLKINI